MLPAVLLIGVAAAAPAPELVPAAGAPAPVFIGSNIPWNHFGYDIGGGAFEPDWFEAYFQGAAANGSNTARFWLHCDGRSGLVKDNASGLITGLSPTFAPELKQLVALAAKHKIVLQLTLWSFDMCKNERNSGSTMASLISDPAKTMAYTQAALRPLLGAVAGAPNVLFEVINEPEWCMKDTPCNTKDCVTVLEMQRFIAVITSVIHESAFKVTVGSASLKWNSPTTPPAVGNWWSDSALKAAATTGCASPTLDLFNVHFYDWMVNPQWGYDPLRANTTYWGLDKPTVIGEIPTTSKFYNASNMLQVPFDNGFRGSVFWAFNDPQFPLGPAVAPMAAFSKTVGELGTYAAVTAWLQDFGAAGNTT